MMGPSREWRRRGRIGVAQLARMGAACVLLSITALGARAQMRFNRDVRPIMSETCFKCHGPATHKAGLRLDLRDAALKPLESKATPIVPGHSDQSEIVRRIFATDPDELMPPPKSHKVLTEA